jgi:glycosyltransferase involved in cell wall biosynthesis
MNQRRPEVGGARSAAARRSLARQGDHARRLAAAARWAGPGRLAGGVVGCDFTHDQVVVGGWAGLPGRGLVAVLVTVDGTAVGAAQLGLATPCDLDGRPFSTRGPDEGWQLVLGRRDLPDDVLRVGGIAVFDDGLTEPLLELEAPVPPRVLATGSVDHPVPGATIDTATFTVRGWLLDPTCDRVEVRIGDAPPRRARLLAEARPDLAALVDDPIAPVAGWHLLVDAPLVDRPTTSEIVVTAVGGGSTEELARCAVTFVPPAARPEPDADRLAVLAARTDAAGAAHRTRRGGLHLLVVTHDLGLGGGQLYLHEVLRLLLQAEDVSCTVLAPVDGPLRADLEAWGARVHTTGHPPGDGLGYEARMLELCQLVTTTGANAALVNTTGSFWGVDLAARCGLPAAWAIHESFPLDQYLEIGFPAPLDAAVERRLRATFQQARAVLFEADATRRLYDHLGEAARFVRLDYGVDLEQIERYEAAHDRDALRAAEGIEAHEVVLLCLGTYEPRKAQAALAAAFARVAGDHPAATLALVGDTGTHYAEGVRALAGRLGLGDRLRLVPVTADIDAWYRIADGFVLASDIESLPRSILEALAYGLPVVSTAVFGVPELLTDGDTGILVEPGCLAALTDGLDRFLGMPPDRRRAMAERGRALVRPARPSKHYADAYRVLLERLVGTPDVLPGDVLDVE